MKNQISIREAITKNDVAFFWEQLHSYHKRDIFPDPADEDNMTKRMNTQRVIASLVIA